MYANSETGAASIYKYGIFQVLISFGNYFNVELALAAEVVCHINANELNNHQPNKNFIVVAYLRINLKKEYEILMEKIGWILQPQ